jgi:single-strand DNA-binding protein
MAINTFCISGRLTRSPEMFVSKSGTSMLKFGLAHNERRLIDEEWKDVPHFFDCVIFAGYGEMLEHKLRKGDEITATGRLSWSSWENDQGEKRSKVELIINQLVGEAVYRKNGQPAENDTPGETLPPADDDIPF